jgi:hypothetical protein
MRGGASRMIDAAGANDSAGFGSRNGEQAED